MFKIIFLILSIQVARSEEDQLCVEKKNEKCISCVEYAKIQKDKCECQSGYFNQKNTTFCYQCSPYCKKCNSQGLNNCLECYNGEKENNCRCGTDQVFVGQLQKCVAENKKIQEMKDLYKDFNSCNSTSKLSDDKLQNIFNNQGFEFTSLSDYASVLKVEPKNNNIIKNLKNKVLQLFRFNFDSYKFNGTMVNGQNNEENFLIFEIYNLQDENQYLLALMCENIDKLTKTAQQQTLLSYFHLFHNPPKNCNSSTFVDATTLTCTSCINGFTLVNNTCIYQYEDFYKQIQNNTSNCTIPNCQTCGNNSTCDKCLPGFNLVNQNETKKCDQQYPIIMQTNETFLEIIDNINLVCKKEDKCVDCFNDSEITPKNLNQKNCQCNEGYFFDSQQMKCQECDRTKCKTCVNIKTKCLSCQEKQFLENNQCFDCDDNCEVCNNKDDCTECKKGFSLNQKKKCYVCPKNCDKCVNQDCIQAMPGYYVDQKKKVQECDKSMHCANCESLDVCKTCLESYYLEKKKCQKCEDGCIQCSKDDDKLICHRCQDEYYSMIELEGKCVPCTNGCKSCQQDFQVCDSCESVTVLRDGKCYCDEGKYFDSEAKECQKLMKGCSSQQQNDKCETCIETHYLNDYKQCEECKLDKCVKCKNKDQCDKCQEGYYKNKDKCEQCISGCQSCESKEKCDKCKNGYFINDKKQCEQCISQCKSCESKGKCDECKKNHFLNEKKLCDKCLDGCKECKSKEKCEKCDDDYQQTKEGLCKILKCKANCKTCSENDGCDSCIDGFNLNKDDKICSCPVNCKNCELDKNNKDICKVCNDGYYAKNGICEKCSDNCLECDNDKTCNKCSSDFILFEGSCLANHCEKKFYDVKTQQCTKCEGKYYLDIKKICQKCTEIQNCSECIEKDQCQKCDNEYYLKDKNQCIKCEENCLNCDAAKCIKCQSGYDIIKTECIKQTNSTLFIGLLFLIALFYGIYNYREQIQQLCINQNRIELNQENENDNGDVELQTKKNRPKTKVKSEDNFNILDDN